MYISKNAHRQHIYPVQGENPQQTIFLCCIHNLWSLTNIQHECSSLKEFAKITLTWQRPKRPCWNTPLISLPLLLIYNTDMLLIDASNMQPLLLIYSTGMFLWYASSLSLIHSYIVSPLTCISKLCWREGSTYAYIGWRGEEERLEIVMCLNALIVTQLHILVWTRLEIAIL